MPSFYANIFNTAAGGAVIQAVQSVDVNEQAQVVKGSGDADLWETGIFAGLRSVQTVVRTRDVGHGRRVGNTGTTSFSTRDQGQDAGGAAGASVSYAVVNGKVSGVSDNIPHQGEAVSTITVDHFSSDGVTSPLSIS